MKTFVCQIVALCTMCIACNAQQQQTTPVPILKQVNKQNDDGSYSFGYEAADGSFKIETKYPNGDVAGKYGYVDENGKRREVEYGASSKRGFEPQGNDINVPPPTLDEGNNALTPGDQDDGQYREDPSIYYTDPKYNKTPQPISRPGTTRAQTFPNPQPAFQQQQQQQQQTYQQPQPAPQHRFQFQQQPNFQPGFQSQVFRSQPQFTYQQGINQPNDNQQYQPEPQYSREQYNTQPQYNQLQYNQQPQYNQQSQFNPFLNHPAQNFDINTGSYSISYTG